MQIHPIHHSGFLVETARCCYLFDYYKGALPPLSPEKPVIVFASHSHPDHYEPRIFPLLKESGVRHISAVLSSDIFPNRHPQGVPVLTVQPGRTYALPGGEVLDTLLSTDCGDPADPPWEYAIAQYLHEMEAHGVSRDALRRMTHTLPAQLLGLEDAAE